MTGSNATKNHSQPTAQSGRFRQYRSAAHVAAPSATSAPMESGHETTSFSG